jgi:hypothetical protein
MLNPSTGGNINLPEMSDEQMPVTFPDCELALAHLAVKQEPHQGRQTDLKDQRQPACGQWPGPDKPTQTYPR